jgi:hypothetical protein
MAAEGLVVARAIFVRWLSATGVVIASAACEGSAKSVPAAASGSPGAVTTSLVAGSRVRPSLSAASPVTSSAGAPDGDALSEVVAQVPSLLPPTSASGTLVGTDTEVAPSDAGTVPVQSTSASTFTLRPDLKLSSAGIERALRATVFYDLVDQCRDASGTRLPPEVIEITLRLDGRGRVERSTTEVRELDPRYATAASCMLRVLRTADLRLAPAMEGEVSRVTVKVPSVD